MSEKSSFGERTEEWFMGGGEEKKAPLLLPVAMLQWLDALEAQGLFVEDSLGDQVLAPGAVRLIRALNVVLAGGEVSVNVDLPADDAVKRELDRKLDSALAAMIRRGS